MARELDASAEARINDLADRYLPLEDATWLKAVVYRLANPECGARIHIGGGVMDTCPKPKGHPGKCTE